MPSGQDDSTGFSSVGASDNGVLKTGDSFVDEDGGSGAGSEERRDIVLENGLKTVGAVLIGNCEMREPSAEAL